MGILQKKSSTHWSYFLAVERDLELLSRYVEFANDNLQAYSLEMARIILAAASEVDVLLKALCERFVPGCGANNILKYQELVRKHFSNFAGFEVALPRWEMNLIPWSNWERNEVPIWWNAYNKVKHHRDKEYHRANLHNALNAASGLFVANLYFHRQQAEEGSLLPNPALFRPGPAHFDGTTVGGVDIGINYRL